MNEQHTELIAPGDTPIVVTLRHAAPPVFSQEFDAELVRAPFGTALHLAGTKQLLVQKLQLNGTIAGATPADSDDLLELLHLHAGQFTQVRLGTRLVPIVGIVGPITSTPTFSGYRVSFEVAATDTEWGGGLLSVDTTAFSADTTMFTVDRTAAFEEAP